ncbi:plastid transcriptionally active 5 [Arabidopsis thaliana]|uniref:Protein disulfide isomerase pTAC5, chloroplastic n=2 Tax=Arabidopsis thaliana TaxID=3702 RepID=PTAC5_ARATH|nr:plastid transcriptionally active 5 [Arabidopsis thaliana]A1A6M1.1 RecName: Full=Protein disulfide isomerase pTAC5, chloroplastic; AltName: Full=Protein PLASTID TRANSCRIPTIONALLY ACTIVE 5; Short=pTAC5; Flags: Precursor [Arabidopsis thaliana]ABL66797.1 At4g13670 [Arabidopsis thaliana]AEE83311.1 plastid transcriptionally active 5 [Arabidopsis thaliana]|eukprot:NP_193103.2 plastid transcriptionally active 5 [Arabidopsis thaliana]
MASSSLPLSLPFPLRSLTSTTRSLPFQCSPLFFSIPSSIVCFSTQNPDREEVRWLREEQRWIREEQRWIREEQRWIRERESLLQEISDLQLRIQSLESRNSQLGNSIPDTISNIAALLQVLKEKNRISESGLSATPMVLESTREQIVEEVEEEEKRVIIAEEKVRVSEPVKKIKRRILKVGSEGDDVQALQEALLKLGFYSGEEDMEFSSFSSGTASAVKTWQASLGVREDGVMTAELLQRLFMDEDVETDKDEASTMKKEEAGNGAVFTSVTQVPEKKQSIVKDQSDREVDVTQNRVFLLGENRWEDPSRLIGRNKPVDRSESTNTKTRCITCRGEGRLMCLECDGTGEPNIEPQFMEWVGEDTKCPYCEGLGYTVCDVCDGKKNL